MSARALHEFTDLLPLVDVAELTTPPPALGTATLPAMAVWAVLGCRRRYATLIDQLQEAGSHPNRPQVFLTGGAGASVAELLGPDARYVPNLTLTGIALAAGTPSI